jgi:nitrogen fixation NifU-like protein
MSASEQDIYEEHVLDHYEDPYHRGPLDDATHSHEGKNPLCGDVIHVDLKLDDDGKVVEAWFDGDGCVISQASASMLTEAIEGKTLEEVQAFSAAEMLELFGPKLTPNRQKCCLLSWRILQSAMHSPIGGTDDNDDDHDDNLPKFGGPTLGEES